MSDLYLGLFRWQAGADGRPHVLRHEAGPAVIPCPTTGRLLRVATIDANTAAICPSCATHGQGRFVSFDARTVVRTAVLPRMVDLP